MIRTELNEHGDTRKYTDTDEQNSVTLRENPCSSKIIRKIRKISTELNEHGDTRKYTEAEEQKNP